MLKILIVEDDSQLATTLKYLVEDNPRYRVVAIADDADNAVAAAEYHNPDLALVDLHLARGSTGFSAAVRLSDFEVHRALNLAEDRMRGRETVRPRIPQNLHIYDEPEPAIAGEGGFIPSKRSLRTRIEHWIAGQQQHRAA